VIYVFDTNTLIDLFRHYYPSLFPSLWGKFDKAVQSKGIICVREVLNEVEQGNDRLSGWATNHREFFLNPTPQELAFVAEIFAVPQFQALVRHQQRLQGKPVADPFVIAKAKQLKGCVVTEETSRQNAAKIPTVCEHFGITCLNLEGFMEKENWTF
jgi:hypothetical protein